jgi:23S rRNA (uridine2552-2'-O)-methyltransferase
MDEHLADHYVQQARRSGYRSRAAYKLLELDRRDRLLKGGLRVVDLGAAPGSWSQVAAAKVAPGGTVVAVDLLAMAPLAGVVFLQGDMRDPQTLAGLALHVKKGEVDLVLSDMAPNLSGVAAADAARAQELVDTAAQFAADFLRESGSLVAKLFHGHGFDESLAMLRRRFRKVSVRKPAASRDRSAEAYVVAAGPRRGIS